MIDYFHILDCYGEKLINTNGRQLNFIDYSQHFMGKQGVENFLLMEKDINVLDKFRTFFYSPSIQYLRDVEIKYKFVDPSFFENNRDILLCDFVTFMLLAQNVELKYNKIYIFDCLELTLFFNDENSDKSLIRKYSPTFLVTDYNNITEFNTLTYYKKINYSIFNKEYINSINRIDKMVYYYAKANDELPEFDSFLTKIKNKYPDIVLTNNFMDVWEYSTVLYTQKPYVYYIEQFGRMIFELRHFGYELLIDNMFQQETKTGLEYYLDHYTTNSSDLNDEDFIKWITMEKTL